MFKKKLSNSLLKAVKVASSIVTRNKLTNEKALVVPIVENDGDSTDALRLFKKWVRESGVQDVKNFMGNIKSGADFDQKEIDTIWYSLFSGTVLLDPYTPKERIAIFDMLISTCKDSQKLASDKTLELAINHGRFELISGLVEKIGLKAKPSHLISAAHPIYRRDLALPTIVALIPHLNKNELTSKDIAEAGRQTATYANLAVFKVLENIKLPKVDVRPYSNIATYAHAAVWFGIDEDKGITFLKHLKENDYPIDDQNPHGGEGFANRSPADYAFENMNLKLGLYLLESGAQIKPLQLVNAMRSASIVGRLPTFERLVNLFDEKGVLTQEVLTGAFEVVVKSIFKNEDEIDAYAPVVNVLRNKGLGQKYPGQIDLAEKIIANDRAGVREILDFYFRDAPGGPKRLGAGQYSDSLKNNKITL